MKDIKIILLMLVYATLSASGLIFLKLGAKRSFSLKMINSTFNIEIDVKLILGLMLYLLAFISSLIIMKYADLNFFYPVSAGLVYVLVCFGSYFFIHEQFSNNQLIGITFIAIGVICMNIRK